MLDPSPTLPHVGGLSDAVAATPVPSWLTLLTGGALVGASFLFVSLLTDHAVVRAVNDWGITVPVPLALRRALGASLSAAGLLVLAGVVVGGVLGAAAPATNFAVLVVWVGWWAGYTASTYLLGNSWPAVNPWRTLARRLPSTGGRRLPARYGAWPSVLGLLALVWVEIVGPLAADPRALVAGVLGYTAVTLAGARRYGVEVWFERVDPLSRVFRCYGAVAPVQFVREADTLRVRLHGAALTGRSAPDSVAPSFVVALLWVTTFDGLVATPVWNTLVRGLLGPFVGGPAGRLVVWLFYLLVLLVGFAAFLGAYRLAAVRSRDRIGSLLAPAAVERRFAPALLPIAAGYHLAHFLGYLLTLSPALVVALTDPLGGAGTVRVLVLPPWFGALQLGLVVGAHLLAVWVGHALAIDLLPGALRPIRSQYPFVVVMVAYTMTGAWVVGQPTVTPAFL
jgi:hypothetical protein